MNVVSRMAAGAIAALVLVGCGAEPQPTPQPPDPEAVALLADSREAYAAHVAITTADLTDATADFAAAYVQRDDARARELYLTARTLWWSIDPVFAQDSLLILSLDAREADLLPREAWTGWHAIAADLWSEQAPGTDDDRARLADQLLADTALLEQLVSAPEAETDPLAVATALIDQALRTGVTGTHEAHSGLEVAMIDAKAGGVRAALNALGPFLVATDPALADQLAARLVTLERETAHHGNPDAGFASYEELTHEDVLALERAANALAEELWQLEALVNQNARTL